MPASNKMFAEQLNLTMPPSVWLHVNGISLATDINHYQPPVRTYDYQTKHLQTPVQTPTPPLAPSPAGVPCSVTTIDGPYSGFNNHNNNTNRPQYKLENIDVAKKLFIDKNIKKAKSLPGLIKGTALQRHTPHHSSTFSSPAPQNSVINKIPDDQLPNVNHDNGDVTPPQLPEPIEQNNEIRRPRVYFADYNKIQFFEDNNELSQQQQNTTKVRRYRNRTPKKASNMNGAHALSPSIQQTQVLNTATLPLSHHQITQELNIKKQQINFIPRSHLTRSATHLPNITNEIISHEQSSNENSNGKYILQREKPIAYFPKPASDLPVNSSLDMTTETVRLNNVHSTPRQSSHTRSQDSEIIDSPNTTLNLVSSSIASTSTNRQRVSLQTISLRQQFSTPNRTKAASMSLANNPNNQQQQASQISSSKSTVYRSISLKSNTSQTPDENDNASIQKSSAGNETRPTTANGPNRQIKRSDVIHFNPKHSFGMNANMDSNKSQTHESIKQRFQNLLTIVRPPYATNSGTSYVSSSSTTTDSPRHIFHHNQPKGHIRSSRSTSARGSVGLHITQNTIIV